MAAEKRELAIIGGGPAGLAAAIEAAKAGVKVLVIDENDDRADSCLSSFTSFLAPRPTMQVSAVWT